MDIEQHVFDAAFEAAQILYGPEVSRANITLQKTNLQFRNEGDYTLMVFPLTRFSRQSPEETARGLGEKLMEKNAIFRSYGIVKGFLNLRLQDAILNKHLLFFP